MRPLSPAALSAARNRVWSEEATSAIALAAEFLSSERREVPVDFIRQSRPVLAVKARPIECCPNSFECLLARFAFVHRCMVTIAMHQAC